MLAHLLAAVHSLQMVLHVETVEQTRLMILGIQTVLHVEIVEQTRLMILGIQTVLHVEIVEQTRLMILGIQRTVPVRRRGVRSVVSLLTREPSVKRLTVSRA